MSGSEMSDVDEDELPDMAEFVSNNSITRCQVSGWDDDNEGIEEEPAPHETPAKEMLWAAENGELTVVERLVRSNSSVVTVSDDDGYTPLHRACYNNHIEVVDILLRNGADIAAKTEDEWQPLHSACKWNSYKCAELLISRGADINAITKGGITPLHLAASNSYARETIELLLLNSEINPDIKNSSNDYPVDIARRAGKHYPLFDIVEPCFNI